MTDGNVFDITRLPLGLNGFSDIRTSNMIYVDKTNLIFDIASQRSPIFFHVRDGLENHSCLIHYLVYLKMVSKILADLISKKSGKIKLIKWLTLIFQL